MFKMLFLIFLVEIISFAKSGNEIIHDASLDQLNNLVVTEPINSHDFLPSLQFQPASMNFNRRSINDPHNQVVILFNKHKNRSVYLGSITGSSSDFYSSYFENKVIPPESNTTFKIVFLPRQLGETNSSLIIHTSFGVVNYSVRGVGVECQYRLRPLIGIKLPLNATISPEIQLYNPHDFSLQISEIYSSGGDFHLELPHVLAGSGQEGDWKLWEIPPYTTKSIIRVRFTGYRAGNHTAYVRIKIAGNPSMDEKMLMVPIEIEIYNETGVYSQIPLLDFGIVGLHDGIRRYVYDLLNSGRTSISIKNWGIDSDDMEIKNSQCVNVDVVQFSRRNFTDHLTVEANWSKCMNVPYVVRGHIYLIADISSDDDADEVIYRIPFYGHVIEGHLGYMSDDLKFLRSDKDSEMSPRTIKLTNSYNVPVAITNLTVPDTCKRYFKLAGFRPIILQPGSTAQLLDIQPLAVPVSINQTTHIENFRIVTNVTHYDIDIMSYTGLLRRIVPVDFARERSQMDEKALNFGALLPVSKHSELLIAFVNENPIPINITNWKGAITSGNGQAEIKVLQRGISKMSVDDLVCCDRVIRPGEWIVFAVSVQSTVVGAFGGHFTLTTLYETIVTPVKFSTAMGRLELKSKMIFDDCFPGKICSLNVQAYSTFMKKMYVEGIAVDMDGISYEFAVNGPHELPEILPNVHTEVGRLFFNPKDVLCKKRSTCYTSFEALSRPHGEAWMRTLANHSAYTRWDNERLKTQLNSFMEVKQSLKQMQFRLTTTQIRRFEFNASINFIWPRLMNANIDFPFVQVNKLDTRFIEIYNPSSQALFVHFVLHNVTQFGDKVSLPPEAIRDCPTCSLSRNLPFTFNTTHNHEVFMDEVKPQSYLKVGINFFTTLPGTYSTLLYMRNNLTVVEAVWLSARAVVPQFKFGNRKPGTATPLQFEINDKHMKLCEKKSSIGANVMISSKRSFTAKNHGEVPLMIYGVRVENDLCVGYGFKVLNCEPFELQPNESRKIEIAFSPDFTLSRVVRTLNFDTSIGMSVNFTLIGTVASPALEMCSKNIQRPHWEQDFKRNTLIVLSVALILVVLASVIDSDRILKEHIRMMSRERGPIQPPLDFRKIAMEANSAVDDKPANYSSTIQERLNNLNNHQTSLNNIRKRLTVTKRSDASGEASSNGRFSSLNKPWTDFRNKITGTKVTSSAHNNNISQSNNNESSKNSPRPYRHEMGKGKREHHEISTKECKKASTEDDSVSSTSSKENCEVSSPKSTKFDQHDSPPLKIKNSAKKSKPQHNGIDSPKEQKNVAQKTPNMKPSNTSYNQNRVPPAKEPSKPKIQSPPVAANIITPPPAIVKLNGDVKNNSPTSNASSNEGQHQNNHVVFSDIITDTNGSEINTIKNDAQTVPSSNIHQQQKKYGKTPGRERKISTNLMSNNNLITKRTPLKDNKQFQFKQNLSSAFTNAGKMMLNGQSHQQGTFGASNWIPTSNIWSNTSYSEVVAIDSNKIQASPFNLPPNGMVNGVRRHQDHQDLPRINSFNGNNDRYVEKEDGSQYGPIGTKKSPSSTPSWEPLTAGLPGNHHIAKPSPFSTNTSYFTTRVVPASFGQSKLMNLMSHNEKSQQQLMEEKMHYIMKMKEHPNAEWMNAAGQSQSSGHLWSPAYRINENPSPPSWQSPSPPLSVPPGFENQFQQHNAQNHQNNVVVGNGINGSVSQAMPAYDPFKSLSAIWAPNPNRIEKEQDKWNQ